MPLIETLLTMITVVGFGVLWRYFQPGSIAAETLRNAITDLVYYLLLPALVVRVLWQTPLGVESIQISVVACSGILSAMLLSSWSCRRCNLPDNTSGAVILAASFGNFTYLGLPVLVATLGDWAAGVAIQFDLFASTPLLFTIGFLVAAHYGHTDDSTHPVRRLLRIPPLWAALVAVVLNMLDVPMPAIVGHILQITGDAVIPLMLLALGLSLRWQSLERNNLSPLILVLVIQLIFMPLIVLVTTQLVGLTGPVRLAAVLEAAMPSMMIGLVICQHYKLDIELYAAAVTVSTLASVVTLPFWYILLV